MIPSGVETWVDIKGMGIGEALGGVFCLERPRLGPELQAYWSTAARRLRHARRWRL